MRLWRGRAVARARKPKLVRFEDGVYWLVAKLAAEKSGLTKPELARRALAGELRYQANQYGMPIWYAEPDIDPLRKARLAQALSKPVRKPRVKSAAQMEKEWAKSPKLTDIPFTGAGVARHIEKVMLAEIHLKKKREKE